MTPDRCTDSFLLGIAAGLTVLTMTAYRRASPSWLRWLLFASGLLILNRYLFMARFVHASVADQLWSWRYSYFAKFLGFALPSVMVIDQLLRHPKMSPQRLLTWVAPLFLVDAVALGIGANWISVRIVPCILQWVFIIGFIAIIMLLLRQPYLARPVRHALIALLFAYLFSGVIDVLLFFNRIGGTLIASLVYTDIVVLLALWYAYDTSASLSQIPGS